jgi:adenosylcobalamin-dependent ribonucleoside-triphosphate reductase
VIKDYYPGMGQAVADRTVNRSGETWRDVAARVAKGNASLDRERDDEVSLRDHLERATILMSGRHLQHGDETQPTRPQEVFTNCSTAMTRAMTFYLLLNGSGVGSSYDDDICNIVDWSKMPKVVPVLTRAHPDWTSQWPTREEAENFARAANRRVITFKVPDSREGWAQAIEVVEELTFLGKHSEHILILDFSDVRPKGSPIMGMQGRPSSGPLPLMESLARINLVKDAGWAPWRQAMQIDHEFAECVLVGGARRSARIAVKYWQDKDILDFIRVKRIGGLWSANNSVGVDAEFWASVDKGGIGAEILDAIVEESYGNGEPGMLNLDLLHAGELRPSKADIMNIAGRFPMGDVSYRLREVLASVLAEKKYWLIVNPCGEIRLFLGGGYCVIADVVPHHSKDQHDFEEACRLATRALIRTNLMPAMYQGEVNRTNRIGVGPTGLHEYAMSRFGLTFYDLIAAGEGFIYDANGFPMPAPSDRAWPFWKSLQDAALAIEDEAERYAKFLGVARPATRRTIKPAGTTSKLFGLTEGAHLPPMRFYLRWVQFRSDDPLVAEYRAKGYPVRELETYSGTTIVGFPTKLEITNIARFPELIVTAPEASPTEQFRWLRLLERFWLLSEGGNQVSYTLKYDPKVVDRQCFHAMLKKNMRMVRAVSVMPAVENDHYEYLPETEVTAVQFAQIEAHITSKVEEDVGAEHLQCSAGVCPISFNDTKVIHVR